MSKKDYRQLLLQLYLMNLVIWQRLVVNFIVFIFSTQMEHLLVCISTQSHNILKTLDLILMEAS